MLNSIIIKFWVTKIVPNQWNIGRVFVLPKKGDLSLPKNYKGIMLLQIAYQIITIFVHARVLPNQERLDHESQCGFRSGRGCTDDILQLKWI